MLHNRLCRCVIGEKISEYQQKIERATPGDVFNVCRAKVIISQYEDGTKCEECDLGMGKIFGVISNKDRCDVLNGKSREVGYKECICALE